MKGVILAGGRGTRLSPLTKITNKHLLPVYDRPMIFFPIRTLIKAGIKEIMIITSGEYSGHFLNLLGSGSNFGVKFTFEVQDQPLGIADALSKAEEFASGDDLTVILGDNIFAEDYSATIKKFSGGAHIFLKKVKNTSRFGLVKFDNKSIVDIIEKPKKAPSSYAVTGFYIFDRHVFKFIKKLKPSRRGELEITDVNNAYLKAKALSYTITKDFWSDAGTFDSLLRTAQYIARYPKKFF